MPKQKKILPESTSLIASLDPGAKKTAKPRTKDKDTLTRRGYSIRNEAISKLNTFDAKIKNRMLQDDYDGPKIMKKELIVELALLRFFSNPGDFEDTFQDLVNLQNKRN